LVRPAVIPKWDKHIYQVFGKDPNISAARLQKAIEEVAKDRDITPPSPRTVGRIKEQWAHLTEDEKRLYREFHWPDSFINDGLPWECADMALQVMDIEVRGRPLIRNLLWCWRITQSKPDAEIGERWRAACGMAAWEIDPERNGTIPGQVEAWLRGHRPLGSIWVKGSDEAIEALMGAMWERQDATD
jgi:hypothetical protein